MGKNFRPVDNLGIVNPAKKCPPAPGFRAIAAGMADKKKRGENE